MRRLPKGEGGASKERGVHAGGGRDPAFGRTGTGVTPGGAWLGGEGDADGYEGDPYPAAHWVVGGKHALPGSVPAHLMQVRTSWAGVSTLKYAEVSLIHARHPGSTVELAGIGKLAVTVCRITWSAGSSSDS